MGGMSSWFCPVTLCGRESTVKTPIVVGLLVGTPELPGCDFCLPFVEEINLSVATKGETG